MRVYISTEASSAKAVTTGSAGVAKAETGSNGSVTDAASEVRRVMVCMIGFLLSVEILWRW